MCIRFKKHFAKVVGICLVFLLFFLSSHIVNRATSFSDNAIISSMHVGHQYGFNEWTTTPVQDNPDWINMNPSPNPGPRGYFGLTYDSESDVVILYGGILQTGTDYDINDTWAYSVSSNSWTNMSPTVMPPGGARGTMAYDSKNDVVIQFGGKFLPDLNITSETWAYDYNSNTWTNMTPGVSPPGRDAQGMVYDSQSERIIMFGGRPNFQEPWQFLHDTWTYDYNTNTWTNVTPAVNPEARWFHNMVYDSHADRVILFGGYTSEFSNRPVGIKGDTWEFNLESGTWTELTPTISPSPRAYTSMAYDRQNNRTILYGGSYGAGGGDNQVDIQKRDTWAYDYNTNTWTDMNSFPNPGYRMRHCMVYANESGQMIMYGGQLNDEWGPFNSETWRYTYQPNPPSAPQNLAAVSGTDNIALTWEATSTDAGSAITGYKVYRGTTPGTYTQLAELGVTLAYSDTTATPGTTFYYTVTAENAIGESTPSNPVSGTIPLPPPIPGFPIAAITIGITTAMGLGLISRRQRKL